MTTDVIGREAELGSIEAFLSRVEEGPAALVLSGEPGIGKTILWERGVEEAEHRFGRVLTCRGVEAEASLAFAALSDLVTPVFEEVAPSLAPLRRRALEIPLLLVEPGDRAPDPRAIGLALLDVLHTLAERDSMLVALDDLQWLDPSSAGVLQIALRRLRDERVGVLATARTGPEVVDSFQLDRSFPQERLSLGPLSLGALHHLLRERVGLELTRPELVRVQEASAGNPFFALELGRELVRTGTRPSSGRALPVPESLHELLGGRLARLPTDTGDVVLFAAALARPTVELVAAAHGHHDVVVEALDIAAREGVIELDDSQLRFAHPLLASICYWQAPIWKRRAVHGALARAATDVEERARHMALSVDGPDAVAASYLDAAAEQATARGATAAAAELSELAADLTPADPTLSQSRRLRAARFHRLAGDSERAVSMLEQLLPEVARGAERADVLFELALARHADAPALIRLCEEALGEATGDDARSARILAHQSGLRLFEADVTRALLDARAALEKAERNGDPKLVAVAIARLGHAETWAAELTPGLLERGVEIEERLGLELEYMESPRVSFARLLIRQGELDRARAILQELEARAAARGDEGTRRDILWRLAIVEWIAGRWQQALDFAAAGLEVTEQTQDVHDLAFVGRVRAMVETDLGLADEARASAEEGLAAAQSVADEINVIWCLGALGRLELALGNLDAAGAYLRELPGRALARGLNDPAAAFWADTIETLIALGELERVRAYLQVYEPGARSLYSPWAVSAAARCRGLLEASEGDPAAAFTSFERALAELEGLPLPLERGRTLLCLGTVRRQAQQKRLARKALEQALAIFEELGARLWAEKARAELGRISGRRTSSDELTEGEHRVAELAAQGRTNKEIAAELFMGRSTVEAHLSRVYRKLGLRSRTELAGRIATPRDEAAKARDEAAQA
jgi:DNA-binding CsgD family transcriptional regulator